MKIQRVNESVIYWIGVIAAVTQAIMGILMQAGVLTADTCGAVMTAFAVILQWANGNNPNLAGSYNAYSAVQTAREAELMLDEQKEE